MISTAIHFPGCCMEAIAFYETVFDVTDKNILLNRDAPSNAGMTITEETKDHVTHAELIICGTRITMSDTTEQVVAGNMFVLNVFLDSADEVRLAYQKLKEGGTVRVTIGPQFFSPMYGSVKDRFGLTWQLIS